MANFGLNDTVGVLMRILQHHQEIIKLWHDVSSLLQKLGLVSAAAVPMRAAHAYDVAWVQQTLNKQGASLKVDGIMGEHTVGAVKKFQKDHGLEPDGWIGVLTTAKLDESSGASRSR